LATAAQVFKLLDLAERSTHSVLIYRHGVSLRAEPDIPMELLASRIRRSRQRNLGGQPLTKRSPVRTSSAKQTI
jgi:hypothetical protein